MKLVVDSSLCCTSGACLRVCPVNANVFIPGLAAIDMDVCDLDGICIPACPYGAIDHQDR